MAEIMTEPPVSAKIALVPVGNYFALIDQLDYDRVSQYSWSPKKDKNTIYAQTGIRCDLGKGWKTIGLHRFILKAGKDLKVDHRDGNGLNCLRENLRVCSQLDNTANRVLPKSNKSGFKGVYWNKKTQSWRASICRNYKLKHLGLFKNAIHAALAYDAAAVELFGEFAKTNKMLGLV
jgi:hypothetical protein